MICVNDLKLVKTDVFEEVTCDIYSDGNEIFMTINQLSQCIGYNNGRKGVDNLIARNEYLKNEEFSVTLKLRGTDGKEYVTRVFTEDGIYEVAMLAKTEKALAFKKFIRKVLKDLRKNGIAMTNDMLELTLQNPEYVMGLIGKYAAEKKKNEELVIQNKKQQMIIVNQEQTIESQKQELVIHKNRTKYWNEIVQQPAAMPLEKIVGDYGLSPEKVNRILYIFGVIKGRAKGHNGQNDWQISTKYAELGITTMVQNGSYLDRNGIQRARMYMYWNQRGRFFLYEIFKNIGIKPSIERNGSDSALALETIKEFDRIWKESDRGRSPVYFRDLKERIKDGFKTGISDFIRDLQEGSINELNGDESVDISRIKESDYDMVDFYVD